MALTGAAGRPAGVGRDGVAAAAAAVDDGGGEVAARRARVRVVVAVAGAGPEPVGLQDPVHEPVVDLLDGLARVLARVCPKPTRPGVSMSVLLSLGKGRKGRIGELKRGGKGARTEDLKLGATVGTAGRAVGGGDGAREHGQGGNGDGGELDHCGGCRTVKMFEQGVFDGAVLESGLLLRGAS